jgi:multidrug efflux pump subunit AcrA (membrane-fusion protein)
MIRTLLRLAGLPLLLASLLAACGAPATAQQEPPTPTPLPPDPALERPTYIVQRGTIEEPLELNGRVTPVDLVRLAFHRSGRVETVNVKRGDLVKAGDVLAELQQDEQIEALRQAEDALVQAQRDLESARTRQAREIEQREIALANAQEDLRRLLPGGEDDPIRAAQEKLEDAIQQAKETSTSASEAKTNAEYALELKARALEDAQKAYSKAYWENDWVERYGTHPTERVPDPNNPERMLPRELTEQEKQEFKDALIKAERALHDAEREVALGQREVEKAREQEIVQNDEANEAVQQAQRELDRLLAGSGNRALIEAQRAVKQAQLDLAEARQETFNTEIKAVETAQRAVDKARKEVADGRIVAPQDGEVLALAISEGDEVQEFDSVIEIADPAHLEIAAELPDAQMRRLAEGQAAEVSLLARPDVIMPAVIRRLPAPYGSGGSGAVQEEDRTTRFQITDTKGQTLEPGSVARIRIVLQRKENVLWLPPEAVRSFEGRRFVVVRTGDRERRVTVKLGIETAERVEIVEGLKEGDVVVGQ